MTKDSDKELLKVGIERLGGQAQYDYLLDVIQKTRKEERERVFKETQSLRDYLEENNLLCKEKDKRCCEYCRGFYNRFNELKKAIKKGKDEIK